MKKKIKTIVKIQLPAGKATPAPPVGTALGPHGLNLGEFVSRFNDATKDKGGDVIPVEVTIFEDRSFELKLKTPPASYLIKKMAGIEKGSANALTIKVGTLTKEQVRKIAEQKMEDLNAYDVENAARTIQGTARNMGVEVTE